MDVQAWGLGATRYLPATRDDLATVLLGGRHPDLRSAVVCLEDAVHPRDVPFALALIAGGRARIGSTAHARFDGKAVRCAIVDPVFYDREGERIDG